MIYPGVSNVVSTSGSVFPWPVWLTDGTEMGITRYSRDEKSDSQIRWNIFFPVGVNWLGGSGVRPAAFVVYILGDIVVQI